MKENRQIRENVAVYIYAIKFIVILIEDFLERIIMIQEISIHSSSIISISYIYYTYVWLIMLIVTVIEYISNECQWMSTSV